MRTEFKSCKHIYPHIPTCCSYKDIFENLIDLKVYHWRREMLPLQFFTKLRTNLSVHLLQVKPPQHGLVNKLAAFYQLNVLN